MSPKPNKVLFACTFVALAAILSSTNIVGLSDYVGATRRWMTVETRSDDVDTADAPLVIERETRSSMLRGQNRTMVPVEAGDLVYQSEWDAPAIVVPSHKLVFFAVPKNGCSVWRRLFRRMMGSEDWLTGDPHDPETNGLKYLSSFSRKRATEIMNDRSWTKAIFVRDPKERLLSAYLNKAVQTRGKFVAKTCCPEDLKCGDESMSFPGFINITVTLCPENQHWLPQSQAIDSKFLHLVQFVGHMETVAADAQRLLRRIGAWKRYGENGWGEKGRIFEGTDVIHHTTSANATDSWTRLPRFYTPSIEKWVESIYQEDYDNPRFNLTLRKIEFDTATA